MQLSAFIDIRTIVPSWDGEFYFPLVVMPPPGDHRLAGDRQLALAHELRHVKDLLSLVDSDPDYPNRPVGEGSS